MQEQYVRWPETYVCRSLQLLTRTGGGAAAGDEVQGQPLGAHLVLGKQSRIATFSTPTRAAATPPTASYSSLTAAAPAMVVHLRS